MSKRIDIKFKLETPEQMDKIRYRRRMYRLFVGIFALNFLLLLFFIFQHYGLLPELNSSTEKPEKPAQISKKPNKPSKGGVILTDQMPIFHTGQSISGDDISKYMHPIDTLKASFLSLEPSLNLGLFGIDVSHWQGEIDWTKPVVGANNSDIDFVIVKATQGAKYVDSQFENNWKGAQKAGKKVGAYHFYIYDDDPQAQAKNFVNTVESWKSGMIRPIVDLELDCESCSTPSIPDDELVQKVRAFLIAVEKATGQKPIIYSYSSFYDTYLMSKLSDYDVWIARYTTFKPEQIPVFPEENGTENPTYVMWQFTDRQIINGWKEKADASLLPSKFIDRVIIH